MAQWAQVLSIVHKVVWGIVFAWSCLVVFNWMETKADNVLQQNALAARACGQVIIAYVIARAFDQIIVAGEWPFHWLKKPGS